MPVYDFKCKGCELTFTQRVSYKEKDFVTCQGCGSNQVKQLFTSLRVGKIQGGRSSSQTGNAACGTCAGNKGCC